MKSVYLDYAARVAHVAALLEIIQRRLAEGDIAYLVTFQYRPMGVPKHEQRSIRHRHIERFHRVYCDRVVDRRSRDPAVSWKMPVMIGCRDVPFTGKKASAEKLRAPRPNGGDHDHMIMCTRNIASLRENIRLDEYVDEYQAQIVRHELESVHCVEVTSSPDRVFNYVMKAYTLGYASHDDILVLK